MALGLIVAGGCWAQMAHDDFTVECSLTLKVVDAQGRERPYDVVSLQPLGGGEELAQTSAE